jgi:hypothetical protein
MCTSTLAEPAENKPTYGSPSQSPTERSAVAFGYTWMTRLRWHRRRAGFRVVEGASPGPEIERRDVFSDDVVMQRMLSWSLAVGLVTVGVWALVRRLRSRTTRDDLGTISDAWLHNPRSYTDNSE